MVTHERPEDQDLSMNSKNQHSESAADPKTASDQDQRSQSPRYGEYAPAAEQSTGGAGSHPVSGHEQGGYDSAGPGAYGQHQAPSAQPPNYGQQAPGGGGQQQGQAPIYEPSASAQQPNYYVNQYEAGSSRHRPAGWGLGLASLICGSVSLVLGFLVLPIVAAIVAVILGIIAIVKLKATEGASKVMPIIGIITGALGIIVAVIAAIVWIMIFSFAFEAAEQCSHHAGNSSAYQRCIDEYTQQRL